MTHQCCHLAIGSLPYFNIIRAKELPSSWCSAKLKITFNRLLIYCVGYSPQGCCCSPQILKIRTKGHFFLKIRTYQCYYCSFQNQTFTKKYSISIYLCKYGNLIVDKKQKSRRHSFSQRKQVNPRFQANFQKETQILSKDKIIPSIC